MLDMGEPIKIDYLAEQMIKLSGKEPGTEVSIIYTGLRPGEKLEEELFYRDERLSVTGHDKLLLAHSRKVEWKVVLPIIHRMKDAVELYNEPDLRSMILHLVPEYTGEIHTADTGNSIGSGEVTSDLKTG